MMLQLKRERYRTGTIRSSRYTPRPRSNAANAVRTDGMTAAIHPGGIPVRRAVVSWPYRAMARLNTSFG